MQYVRITVDIAGDQLNSISKRVAVCEIPILEAIHGGPGSVKVHAILGERPVDQAKELDRLRAHYTARDEKGNLIIDACYGNMIGRKLPQTLEEVNKTLFDLAASGKNPEDIALEPAEDPNDFRTDEEIKAAAAQAAHFPDVEEESEELELVPPSDKKAGKK